MPEVKDVPFDLSKLKSDVAKQKQELHNKQIVMAGEGGGIRKSNKRSVLNELVTSMKTGQVTETVKAMHAISETANVIDGVPAAINKNKKQGQMPMRPRQQMNEQVPVQQRQRTGADDWGMTGGGGYSRAMGGGDERDNLFEQNFQQANSRFDQMMMGNNPMVAQNPAYQRMMQQYSNHPQQEQYVVEQPQGNPQVLNEQMELLNEKLEKNLEKMVESTFKSVLTNIYTKQKIQESLEDYLKSEDFIKAVGRAINEIATRKKAK